MLPEPQVKELDVKTTFVLPKITDFMSIDREMKRSIDLSSIVTQKRKGKLQETEQQKVIYQSIALRKIDIQKQRQFKLKSKDYQSVDRKLNTISQLDNSS